MTIANYISRYISKGGPVELRGNKNEETNRANANFVAAATSMFSLLLYLGLLAKIEGVPLETNPPKISIYKKKWT